MLDLETITQLFKASPALSIILYPQAPFFRVAWVNPMCLLHLEVEIKDLLDLSVFEVFEDPTQDSGLIQNHTLRCALAQSLCSKSAATPGIQQYKARNPTSENDKLHYLKCSTYPLLDKDENVVFIVLNIEETISKAAKVPPVNSLHIDGAFDHPLFQDYPDAIFTLSTAGKFLSANKVLLEIAECSYNDLVKQSFVQFIAPEDLERVLDNFQAAINGKIQNFDTKIVSYKGNLKFLNLTHLPIVSDQKVVGVYLIAKDITLRKQQEVKLNEAKQQYQDLFELSPLPQFVYDISDLLFKDVNHAAIAHYGYSKAEFLSMTIMDIRPAEDIPMVKRLLKEKLQKGGYHKGLFRHIKKTGEMIDVQVAGNAIVFEGQSARLVLAVDITEKLSAARALIASEQRFKALIQDGSDLIGILDHKGNYLYVNQTSQRVLGIPPEYFIGKNAFDFMHEQDRQRVTSNFEQLVSQKSVKIPAFRFKNSDGQYRWIETIVTNMTDDPSVAGIVSNSRDVTERIENELKVQQSIERFNIVSKATSDAIWDFDLSTGLVVWNEAIKSLFGYKERVFTRNWWQDHVHPSDQDRVLKKITTTINSKRARLKIEYRFRCADGSYKYVLDRSFLVYNDLGELLRIIGSMEDITERQVYIQTVESQNQRLKEIAWTQSHVVRAPLANIMGIVDLLLDEIDYNEAQGALLAQLSNSARDLDTIIKEIIRKTEMIHKLKSDSI